MLNRLIRAATLVAALGFTQGACTTKDPIVDTSNPLPTDPTTGTPGGIYNGVKKRGVDRGWRLVLEDPGDGIDTAIQGPR